VPYASKEELYALVWQQRNICNLSGLKGDWETNPLIKLAFDFDEIVPSDPADNKVKGGDYTLHNIHIVLVAINEMKWNYSNEEAIKYLNTRP
jgi:hypothetical protein